MARVYKPTYTKPVPPDAEIVVRNGKRFVRIKKRNGRADFAPLTQDGLRCLLEAEHWYARYKDANGVWRKKKGYTDKEATEELARKLQRHADREKEGLTDPFESQRSRPLIEHLDDYRRYLEAKGNGVDHVALTISRIQRALVGCHFDYMRDLSPSRLLEWLADARRGATTNHQHREYAAGGIGKITKTYADIARTFGVSESTVRNWRLQGAPIKPRSRNDLAAIVQWYKRWQAEQTGIGIETSNHYLKSVKILHPMALEGSQGSRRPHCPFIRTGRPNRPAPRASNLVGD